MDINSISGSEGMFVFKQAPAEKKEEAAGQQQDTVEIGGSQDESGNDVQAAGKKKPGGISCYMVGPISPPKDGDAEKIEAERKEALAKAVTEGIVSQQAADKLNEK
jgi:hypothetical protein